MNPCSYLRDHAAEHPDQVALHFPSASYRASAPSWDAWTFAQLDARSDALARGFSAQGIGPGVRTLMLMKPSLDLYGALFALMKLGAVPVLLDPGMGVRALLACVAANKPEAMIAFSAVHAVASVVRRPFASVRTAITVGPRLWWGGASFEACAVEGGPVALADLPAEADFAVVFTSGSTGTPKGVSWTQQVFHSQVEAIREMLQPKPGSQQVQCFASFAIHNICWGQTAILPKMNLSKPATADPANIVAAIEHFKAETAFASPIVWVNVGRHCQQRQLRLPSLQQVLTTGAPLPVWVHQCFRQIVPEGTQIFTPYGATEAMGVAVIGGAEILSHTQARTERGEGTCVGAPAPGIQIRLARITDDAITAWSPELEAPSGEIGEVVVCGGQVSPSYYDAPGANALAKIQDGDTLWHRMGDLGRFDDQGRLWFCGRKSHRLQTPQGMVPTVPVEGVFNAHPAVLRSALVGPGAPGQQVPVLCVELEPGHQLDDALRAELEALAVGTPYQGLVQRFIALRSFPVDARHNSKIRRGELRRQVSARCADLLGAIEEAR